MLETFSLRERSVVLAIAFLIGFVLYLVALVIYRLYFSPIAKFPGPKLAAATYLFEGYYDVVKRGKYTFKIRDLHAEYGRYHQLFPSMYMLKACRLPQPSRTDHSNQPY